MTDDAPPLHKPTTIFVLWRQFQHKTMPQGAPPEQRLEMRRAFYAGAFTMLCEMTACSSSSTEEQGERYLQALSDELVAFLRNGGVATDEG